MRKKTGFERLRRVATTTAAIGAGLLGAGNTARATQTNLALTRTASSAKWKTIGNQPILPAGVTQFTTSSGVVFGSGSTPSALAINNASLTTGLDNAFDASLYMAMRLSGSTRLFKNPDSKVDLTGDNLSADRITDFFPGVSAQIEYYFHPSRPLVRALYSFENTSGSSQTFDVIIGGNLGSADATTIQATSHRAGNADTSDTTLETDDRWLVTNNQPPGNDPDNSVATDTPVVTISRFGSGGVAPANGITPGNLAGSLSGTYVHRYTVTVANNATARILVFVELSRSIETAKTCARDFETLDAADAAGLLTGLASRIDLDEIVNYAAADGILTASSCSHADGNTGSSSSGGSASTGTGDNGSLATGALSATQLLFLLSLLTLRAGGKPR